MSVIDDLRSGGHYGVFIDDTGSPGMPNTPIGLHPDRKSWVAVVVPPTKVEDVGYAVGGAVDALLEDLGINEFHFTEIYSPPKRSPFCNISIDERLVIFQMFADFFSIYELPILIQTLDPTTHTELIEGWRRSVNVIQGIDSESGRLVINPFDRFPRVAGCFDLQQHGDAALWLLLMRVHSHLVDQQSSVPGRALVVIDEGKRQPGQVVQLGMLEDVFVDGQLHFASSSMTPLLQLADFAAFYLNRSQLSLRKETRNGFEIELLRILSPIATQFLNATHRLAWPSAEGRLVDSQPRMDHQN